MKNNRQSLHLTSGSVARRTLCLVLSAHAIGLSLGLLLGRVVWQAPPPPPNTLSDSLGSLQDRVQEKGAEPSNPVLSIAKDSLQEPPQKDDRDGREFVEAKVSEADVEKARKVSLKKLLKRAARKADQVEPKAVIVTAISQGWAVPGNVLDVFLGQMRRVDELRALMRNFIIFCLDDFTFRRCLQVHSYKLCYAPEEEAQAVDFSGGELQYMGEPYKSMCWQKVRLAAKAANMGYGVLATDIDMVWFRDPFPIFSQLYPDREWFHSADIWHGDRENFKGVMFNGGFYYARYTPTNLQLYKAWLSVADRFVADQEGMNGLKTELYDGVKNEFVDVKDIKWAILPTHLFGGLCQMVCTLEELKHAVTIHMNCCFRSEMKMERMRAFVRDHEVAQSIENHSVFGNATLLWNKQRYACIYDDIGCSPEW